MIEQNIRAQYSNNKKKSEHKGAVKKKKHERMK
jgi:hypothetical protein